MENITSKASLKSAIVLLEAEQAEAGQVLKEQFFLTYKSFKPVNIIKSTMEDILASPHLLDNILGTTTGLVTGFISKKLISGGSSNVFRKILGSLFQLGITALVARNPDVVKSVGSFIHQHINRKKEKISEAK